MKMISQVLFILIYLFLLTCSKIEGPEIVAEKFIRTTLKGDFNAGSQYVTMETLPLYQMIALMDTTQLKEQQYKSVKCTLGEGGNNARCMVKMISNGQEIDNPLNLEKRDGKWLVVLKKEKE